MVGEHLSVAGLGTAKAGCGRCHCGGDEDSSVSADGLPLLCWDIPQQGLFTLLLTLQYVLYS
jgi:hypothetical protein